MQVSLTRSFLGHVTAGGRYGICLTEHPAVGGGVLGEASVKSLPQIQSFKMESQSLYTTCTYE
jgi:hypothetical protein